MAVSEDCASRSVLSSFTHGACRGNEHNFQRNRGLWGSSSLFLPVNSHSASAKSMLLGTHRQYSSTHSPTETKSQKMLCYLTAVVFGMVGLTYAAVPLYRTFCQATGYGGTVQRKEALYYRLLRRRLLGIRNLAPSLKGRLWCSSMLMLQIGCSGSSLQLKER